MLPLLSNNGDNEVILMSEFMQLVPKKYTTALQLKVIKTNTIILRHGHIAITNYHMGDNQEFEKSLSVFDKMYWKWELVGGYYVKRLKEFRINRGYDLVRLQRYFPRHDFVIDNNNGYPADKIKVELYAAPRDDFQRVALTFMASQGDFTNNKHFTQQLIDADTGDGKAQPDDTLIPTPEGFRRLDEIAVGDKVFSLYGKPVEVLAIYPQHGLQETYEITFKDGRTARCNPEHLWRVTTNTGEVKVIPLSEFIDNYQGYSVPMPEAISYNSDSGIDDSNLWWLGEVLGKTGRPIPSAVLRDTIPHRRQFLNGMLHTGLTVCGGESYTTTSESVKNGWVELVRSLGYLAYVIESVEGLTHLYMITIVKPEAGEMLDIIDIRKLEPTTQRCIYIDDPLHVYITENFIPTHNTYCGVSTAAFLSSRTIIFVPISKLVDQWKDAYLNFTSIKEDEIMVVKGSDKCKKIVAGKCKGIKVFLVMINTFLSYHAKYGDMETIELLRATNAYTKIVDEAHRNMKTVSILEALSNFKMNYYLSASPGRSEQKEDYIFSTLYKNVPRFGSAFKTQDEKHINIMIKRYRFSPDHYQIKQMYRPNVGLNGKVYEKVLIESPQQQKHDFVESIEVMLEWSKKMIKKDNKLLILTQTVGGADFVSNLADKVFPGDVGTYYSTGKTAAEKKEALSKKVICATAASAGTGFDVPGIQHVYTIFTYSNKIDATQLPGRARKLKDGTPVFYVEFVNVAYKQTFNQYERRKQYLQKKSVSGKLMVVN